MNLKDLLYDSKKIDDARRAELEEFSQNLGVRFNDLSLLDLAFHHRSFSNENADLRRYNNERLEFLGDSVLGLATAAFLYEDMIENPEGDMAKIKSIVVSEQTLAPVALEKMHIDRYLVMGRGEELSDGRHKKAILADAVEAVIGALYIDSGYAAAEKLVRELIVPEIRKVQQDKGARDFKTLLQEYCQKKYRQCPVYELARKCGPDHDQTFFMTVRVCGVSYGPMEGKNKKSAEQAVAKVACEAMGLSE
ncbi:MAG: ribonuclease III [Treponema sp.]|nr:ribonuclease III [Treponema sp.]